MSTYSTEIDVASSVVEEPIRLGVGRDDEGVAYLTREEAIAGRAGQGPPEVDRRDARSVEEGQIRVTHTDRTPEAGQSRLTIVPLALFEANVFIVQYHRHHQSVIGHKFSLGVADEDGTIRGVAVVGRPTARHSDDGWTLEVTRVASDGCPNACSALYAACWRAVKALGYRRLLTFTLDSEPGTSLVAAGWRIVGETPGRSWSVPSRPRVDKHPLQGRFRWEPVA